MSTTQRPRNSLLCALAGFLGLSIPGCKQGEADNGTANGTAKSPATPNSTEAGVFPAGPYADRDPELAKQLVDHGALLLDVRSAEEFASGHIDGAVNVSHTEVGARMAEIRELQGSDLHKPIVVYCRSGHRAGLAKRELEAAGFDRVTNLGGLRDWPR